MNYSEFAFINQFESLQTKDHPLLALGIGDDAALVKMNETYSYAICTDTSALNAHFTVATPIAAIGYKSLMVNLSDLAAMGAEPCFYLLNVTAPQLAENWCQQFTQGLAEAAAKFNLICIGGDTTQGVETITITAIGIVETAKALKRQGAKVGDLICVSGHLGFGAFALYHPEYEAYQRYLHYPEAQIDLGRALLGKATAAIDISDGLLADLNHILEASGVGARIFAHEVPGLQQLKEFIPSDEALKYVLTGGDDYQLCFTLPKHYLPELNLQFPITVIGEITAESKLTVLDQSGHALRFDKLGFSHF